ncbi:hypothetical protein BC835DRAFT_1548023 [Cytidiella melzeri]|nr:hypothetical protein BC835DRAFT_1548023 [Cytidiella melzeri]
MSRFHVQIARQVPSRPPSPDLGGGITDVISYISQLGLHDIQSLQSQAHNKDSDAALTDEELALALFAEEAEGLLNITRAHVLGSSNSSSRSILEELEEMEEAARYDHLVALAISQGNPIPPRPPRRTRTQQPVASTSRVVQAVEHEDGTEESESSVSSDSDEGLGEDALPSGSRLLPEDDRFTLTHLESSQIRRPPSPSPDPYASATDWLGDVNLDNIRHVAQAFHRAIRVSPPPLPTTGLAEEQIAEEAAEEVVEVTVDDIAEALAEDRAEVVGEEIAEAEEFFQVVREEIAEAEEYAEVAAQEDVGIFMEESAVEIASGFTDAARSPVLSCTVCGDDTNEGYTAPCGHDFDIPCLREMFRRATHDESLYPPKCCQQRIPISDVLEHLNPAILTAFVSKAVEYDTRDRVYCHRPRCSAFLGAATTTASSYHCEMCYAMTCGLCKSEAHSTRLRCSDTLELNDLAKDMHKQCGWQRCHSCHHLVEKSDGCHHITCICKAQFCYLCNAPWKTCECPQFDVPPEEPAVVIRGGAEEA